MKLLYCIIYYTVASIKHQMLLHCYSDKTFLLQNMYFSAVRNKLTIDNSTNEFFMQFTTDIVSSLASDGLLNTINSPEN